MPTPRTLFRPTSLTATTSVGATISADVASGDVIWILACSRDSTGAGSLAMADNDTGGNTWTKVANSTDHKLTLWQKFATSGTAGKTVTFSGAVGSCTFIGLPVGGVDATTPLTDLLIETNAAGNETHASFSPTNVDSLICGGVVNYANDNAVTSMTFATGVLTVLDRLNTGGNDCAVIFGHRSHIEGPTGAMTWAQTDGTTYSITFAAKNSLTPPASPMSDTFTRAADALIGDHVSDSGHAWQRHTSYVGLQTVSAAVDRLRPNSNAVTAMAFSSFVPATADYDVEGELFAASSAGASQLHGRVDPTTNTSYLVRVSGPDTSATFAVEKIVAGVTTTLASTTGNVFTNATSKVVKLEMRGTAINGYVDGVKIGSPAADSSITAKGRAGAYNFFAGVPGDAAGRHWNFVTATDASVGGGGIDVKKASFNLAIPF